MRNRFIILLALTAIITVMTACGGGMLGTSNAATAPNVAVPAADTGPLPVGFQHSDGSSSTLDAVSEPLYDPDVAAVTDSGVAISHAELDEWLKTADIDREFHQATDSRCRTKFSNQIVPVVQNGSTAYYMAKNFALIPPHQHPIAVYGVNNSQEYIHIFRFQMQLVGVRHYTYGGGEIGCPYWSMGTVLGRTDGFAHDLADMMWGTDGLPMLTPEHKNINVGYYPREPWKHPHSSPFSAAMGKQ